MEDSTIRLGGGRYEVRSLIGRGGMAEVHKGYDNLLSRTVAIKMLRVDLAKDAIFLARFRREAQASASLNHENIVGVYDTGEQNVTVPGGQQVSVPYIVMEYVEGHTVHELLNDGQPVPINEAVEITIGILNALEYSHSKNLVHRDIKPGNVMLTYDGKIKVMDFGIARALEDSGATMTQTDAVVGTAQYLSPEQARGEQVDTRCDLYSCGCILFELLTGRPPFRGDSAVSVAYQHVAEQPPIPSSITGDIPPELDRVVLNALAKRADQRYQTAAAMRDDLIRAAGGFEVLAPPITPTRVSTPTTGLPVSAPATSYQPQTSRQSEEEAERTSRLAAQKEEAAKKRKKNRIIASVLGAVIVLSLITGLLLFFMRKPPAPETVDIPKSVIGMSQTEATSALSALGLEVKIGEPIVSDQVEKDKVAKTDPPPGSKVEVGSVVTLQLSSGKDESSVPDVSGMTQAEARKNLEDAGFEVGSVTTEDDPKIPADRVIRTDPKPGTSLKKGERVALILSSGYVTIDASKVVGKSRQEGLDYLKGLGLSTDTQTVTTDKAPAGQIVRISPDNRVKIGSSIVVEVAQAPTTPPPDTQPNNKPAPDNEEKPDDKPEKEQKP